MIAAARVFVLEAQAAVLTEGVLTHSGGSRQLLSGVVLWSPQSGLRKNHRKLAR